MWVFNLGIVSTGCDKNVAKFVCGQAFMPCHTKQVPAGPITLTTYLPRPLSNYQCNLYKSSCAALLPSFAGTSLYPDCQSSGIIQPALVDCKTNATIIAAAPNFPEMTVTFGTGLSATTVAANNFTVDAYTTGTSTDLASVTAPLTCPAPLVVPQNPSTKSRINGGGCATPCRSLLFTSEQYANADLFFKVLGSISIVLSTFLIATWLVFPEKRKQRMVLYFNSIIFLGNFFLLILFCYTQANGILLIDVLCKDNTDLINTTDGGFCIFFAVVELYCIQCVIFWWGCSAVDLWLKVCMNFRPNLHTDEYDFKDMIFHIVCWGVPAFDIILLASLQALGGSDGGVPWCGVHGRVSDYPQWVFFYAPIMIVVVLGSIAMVWTIVALVSLALKMDSSKNNKRWYLQYIRPAVFVAVMLVTILGITVYRLDAHVKFDLWTTSGKEFVYCLLVTSPKSGFTVDCGQRPANAPILSMWYYIMFVIAGQGTITFMLYGTMQENFELWGKFFNENFGCHCCCFHGQSLHVINDSRHDTTNMQSQADSDSQIGSRAPGLEKKGTLSFGKKVKDAVKNTHAPTLKQQFTNQLEGNIDNDHGGSNFISNTHSSHINDGNVQIEMEPDMYHTAER
jgi:hypothetical protein